FVPVITTVVTTAISTVITVAHTRRGARSIVAAVCGPTDPKIRAVADVSLTMTAVSAKPSAISAVNSAKTATKAKLPRWSTTTPIDAANTATAAIPDVIRSPRGTKKAAAQTTQ